LRVVLSVDYLPVLVLVGSQVLCLTGTWLEGSYPYIRNHHLVRRFCLVTLRDEVGEHLYAVVCAILCDGVAHWRLLVGGFPHVVYILDALTSCGGCGTLSDRVDAHVLLATVAFS
jgi:hypothetical protein